MRLRDHKFRIRHLAFNSSQAGFTLLEVLAAIAVFGIALVVILQLLSANLKGIGASEDYAYAVLMAESKMREILTDEELSTGSWEESTEDGYTVITDISTAEDERTENLPVELLEITLRVSWTDGIKDRTFSLKTVKMVEKEI